MVLGTCFSLPRREVGYRRDFVKRVRSSKLTPELLYRVEHDLYPWSYYLYAPSKLETQKA